MCRDLYHHCDTWLFWMRGEREKGFYKKQNIGENKRGTHAFMLVAKVKYPLHSVSDEQSGWNRVSPSLGKKAASLGQSREMRTLEGTCQTLSKTGVNRTLCPCYFVVLSCHTEHHIYSVFDISPCHSMKQRPSGHQSSITKCQLCIYWCLSSW